MDGERCDHPDQRKKGGVAMDSLHSSSSLETLRVDLGDFCSSLVINTKILCGQVYFTLSFFILLCVQNRMVQPSQVYKYLKSFSWWGQYLLQNMRERHTVSIA